MKIMSFLFLPFVWVYLFNSVNNSQKLEGKVSDEKGQPLYGVSVVIKNSTTGTITDLEGKWSLEKTKDAKVLVFSSLGYMTQEVPIGNQLTIDVVLKKGTEEMDKAVVTALGMKPYAYTTNKMEVSKALSGKASGIGVRGNTSVNMAYNYSVSDDYINHNTEGYDFIKPNVFLKATDNPLSTFSIDVDAASYSNVRRFLNNGQLPPAGAVRIEEMVNYFKYEYPQPNNKDPFSINTEISDAPWNSQHKLVLIGLQGKEIPTENLPASNLVFLIDVSGSMYSANKLPLVKSSLKMLVEQMRPQDKVAIVVYAGAAGMVLPSTNGNEKEKIIEAIDKLEAGGSTAGGEGIRLAYKTAKENWMKGGNNRVILCSDGDFNVGESSDDAMERLIEHERKSGIYLTVLGYGMGNYKDSKMQKLATKGNGNHAYIDGISEAKKVLVNEFGGTLFTIAKDVKLQVEFNPAKVQAYRLIGYENRMLNKEDFNDDLKDAGELGSGHTVTALYEIIPVGVKSEFLKSVDPLKYQQETKKSKASNSNELLTVKFRYKEPESETSKLIVHNLEDNQIALAKTSDNFRFAAAIAQFGMLITQSEFKANSSFDNVLHLAKQAKGKDDEGYRSEFIRLVESASLLAKGNTSEKGRSDWSD